MIRINNLVKIETNKYYFQIIDSIYDNIGYFSLSEHIINPQSLEYLNNNGAIFDFFVRNKELAKDKNITINYFVIVEEDEAYETQCQINLIFKTCYKSCETCYADKDNSNESEHHC